MRLLDGDRTDNNINPTNNAVNIGATSVNETTNNNKRGRLFSTYVDESRDDDQVGFDIPELDFMLW